jgi:hypothetical protein
MRAALVASILGALLTSLGLLIPNPRTIQADAVVLLSSAEPLTAVASVPGRDKHTLSLDGRPFTVAIPRIRYFSGFRFVWAPLPPPVVRLHVQVGGERYRVASYGYRSLWFVEDAATALELPEGESAYRLKVGTIAEGADGVWMLPVRFERNVGSPRLKAASSATHPALSFTPNAGRQTPPPTQGS